jgi:hypothetical protein
MSPEVSIVYAFFDYCPFPFNVIADITQQFGLNPSEFDTNPSGFDANPSGFDANPSGFDANPSGFCLRYIAVRNIR